MRIGRMVALSNSSYAVGSFRDIADTVQPPSRVRQYAAPSQLAMRIPANENIPGPVVRDCATSVTMSRGQGDSEGRTGTVVPGPAC